MRANNTSKLAGLSAAARMFAPLSHRPKIGMNRLTAKDFA
jgi:hypothetical protein